MVLFGPYVLLIAVSGHISNSASATGAMLMCCLFFLGTLSTYSGWSLVPSSSTVLKVNSTTLMVESP